MSTLEDRQRITRWIEDTRRTLNTLLSNLDAVEDVARGMAGRGPVLARIQARLDGYSQSSGYPARCGGGD